MLFWVKIDKQLQTRRITSLFLILDTNLWRWPSAAVDVDLAQVHARLVILGGVHKLCRFVCLISGFFHTHRTFEVFPCVFCPSSHAKSNIMGAFLGLGLKPKCTSSMSTICRSLQKYHVRIYATMRKNLPKTLDQLIFCKYTLVFGKCSQIY